MTSVPMWNRKRRMGWYSVRLRSSSWLSGYRRTTPSELMAAREPSYPRRAKLQCTLLSPVVDWTERWPAPEMILTGVTSNPTPTCPKSRNSSVKKSGGGRFESAPILMAAFASCRFDNLKAEIRGDKSPAHTTELIRGSGSPA